MRRLRLMLMMTGIATAFVAFNIGTSAQPPGGGRGGAGRGGFGGGFGGFRGGFGGWGSSVLTLVRNSAVQTELKFDENMKTQVQRLLDSYNQKRRTIDDKLNPRNANPQGAAQGRGQRGGTAGPGGQFGGRQFGGQAQPGQPGGRGQFGGVAGGQFGGGAGGQFGGGAGGQFGGRQFGGQAQPGQAGGRGQFGGRGQRKAPSPQEQQMRMMRDQARKKLDLSAEQSLKKTIGSPRFTRLKQISYQQQGLRVLLTPEVRTKLNIDDSQAQQIQGILGQGRQLQGAVRKQERDYTKTAGPAFPRGGDNNGRPSREAMQNFFASVQQFREKPEVKAKLEQFENQNKKIDNQMEHEVGRVLTKRQKANYHKLIGPPFDVASLRPSWGRRTQDAAKAQNKTADAKSGANAPAKGGAPAAATATADEAPKAKASAPATKSRRKSLRAARGLQD